MIGLSSRKGLSLCLRNVTQWIRLLPNFVKSMLNSVRARRYPRSAICWKSFPEVTEQTYYRWRQKYGGMKPEMAKQLKALEKENSRLKKMVAEQALDMEILKEAAKGNW